MGAGASAQDVPTGRVLMHEVSVPDGVGAGEEFEFEHGNHMFKVTVPEAGVKKMKVKVAMAREKKVIVPADVQPEEQFEAVLDAEKNVKVTLLCPKNKRPNMTLTCKWIESLGTPKQSSEGSGEAPQEDSFAHQIVPEIYGSEGAPPDDHSGATPCPDQSERLMHYFQDADLEGTGELTFPELCRLCSDMGVGISTEEVAKLYGKLDVDDSHSISLSEIIAAAPVLFPTIASPDRVELGWEVMCYFDGAGYYKGWVAEYLADKSGGLTPAEALFRVEFEGGQEYELSCELVYRARADFMIGRGEEDAAVPAQEEAVAASPTPIEADGIVSVSQFVVDALLAAAYANDWPKVEEGLLAAFCELDVSQTGTLSKEEFHALDATTGMPFDQGFLELMFEELDRDLSGQLTHEGCIKPLLEQIKELYAPGGAAMQQ